MFKRKTKKRPGMRWWFPLFSSCKIMVISFRAGPAICPPYPSAKTGLNLPSTYFYPNKFQNMEKKLLPYIKQLDKGFYLTSKQPDKGFLYVLVLFHAKDLILAFIWFEVEFHPGWNLPRGRKSGNGGGVERKNRWTCWEWGFVDRGGKTLRKLTEAILVLCTHLCSH